MRLMDINIMMLLLVLFFSSIGYAQEGISLQFPEIVNLNEEFEVKIGFSGTGNYDVKLFVHNSSGSKITRGEIISLIRHKGEWKDPWAYLLNSFPEQNNYEIKVTEQPGHRKICLRLRKSGNSKYVELCRDIEVSGTGNYIVMEGDLFNEEGIIILASGYRSESFQTSGQKLRKWLSVLFAFAAMIVFVLLAKNKI